MQIVTKYPDGIFCWVDLSTTDPAGAKAFYSGLLGWEAEDLPISVGGVYTMFKLHGQNVAGGGELPPDMAAQGIPPFWASYIKHDNADEVAAKITAAGGNLMFPPMDVMAAGRMVMAIDPSGATFGVWQPGDHIGANLVNIPGTLVWNELQTRDTAAAKAFYNTVFGWTGEADNSGYVMFEQDGRRHAGMMGMDESWDAAIPAHWEIYFAVDDIAATAEKAKELGGMVLMGPFPAGAVGTMAVIRDPQGAVFSVIQMATPADPPPGHN